MQWACAASLRWASDADRIVLFRSTWAIICMVRSERACGQPGFVLFQYGCFQRSVFEMAGYTVRTEILRSDVISRVGTLWALRYLIVLIFVGVSTIICKKYIILNRDEMVMPYLLVWASVAWWGRKEKGHNVDTTSWTNMVITHHMSFVAIFFHSCVSRASKIQKEKVTSETNKLNSFWHFLVLHFRVPAADYPSNPFISQ